jgi:hypothetical protein
MADVREMRIFSAEQIVVAEDLPKILLDYSKEVIRKNPENVIKFSRLYFEQKCKETGFFEDNREKLEVDITKTNLKKTDKIEDNYIIGDLVGDS